MQVERGLSALTGASLSLGAVHSHGFVERRAERESSG